MDNIEFGTKERRQNDLTPIEIKKSPSKEIKQCDDFPWEEVAGSFLLLFDGKVPTQTLSDHTKSFLRMLLPCVGAIPESDVPQVISLLCDKSGGWYANSSMLFPSDNLLAKAIENCDIASGPVQTKSDDKTNAVTLVAPSQNDGASQMVEMGDGFWVMRCQHWIECIRISFMMSDKMNRNDTLFCISDLLSISSPEIEVRRRNVDKKKEQTQIYAIPFDEWSVPGKAIWHRLFSDVCTQETFTKSIISAGESGIVWKSERPMRNGGVKCNWGVFDI
jgi:hypothetical protein